MSSHKKINFGLGSFAHVLYFSLKVCVGIIGYMPISIFV